MEVNKSYYPDYACRTANGQWTTTISDTADIICSTNLLSHELDTAIDNTVTYATSTSQYATLTTATTFGARYASQSTPKINADTVTFPNVTNNSYQGVYLCRAVGSLTNVNTSKATTYISGGFSPAGSATAGYANVYPVTGFKYYSLAAVPTIAYCSIDNSGSNGITYTDLEGWQNVDKSKYGCCGLFVTVFSGSDSVRQSLDIGFANMQPVTVGSIIHTDDGYKIIESQDILNYFPMYNSGGGSSVPIYKYCHSGVTLYPNETYMLPYPLYNCTICKSVNSNFVEKDVSMWGGSFTCKYNLFDYSEEDILHITATYGLIFTTSFAKARTYVLTDEGDLFNDDLYFPLLENGLWQGNYTHGEDNKNTAQYKDNWNDDINAPFDHGSIVPSGDLPLYGDDGLTNHSGNTSALTHRYLLNNTKMQIISTYLNNVDDNLLTAIVNNIRMSGDSPINSVVSVQYIPFDISTYTPAVSDIIIGSNLINIGTLETPEALTANVVTADSIIIDLGECNIVAVNNNFLDYEPYTKYLCYIPYCNFVELDAGIITNRKLSFQLICDLVGGTCEGIIRVNGRLYKSVSGVFATQCSVQGIDSASYVNSLMSSTGKYVSGVGTMVAATAGIVTGNVSTAIAATGIVAGAGTAVSGLYEYNTTPKQFEASGKSVGLIGQRLPQHVCLYRYYCQDISDENFKDFAGYACEFTAQLSTLSGYTQCANVNLSGISATNEEKEIIKNILETGFYI